MALTEERTAYLALALTPGIGHAKLQALLAAHGSATGALSAPSAFLRTASSFSGPSATAIQQGIEAADRALTTAQQLGAEVLLPPDPAYPTLLREIPDPPTALFLLGDRTLLDRPATAIVGSRDHSPYGATTCRHIATAAATTGLVVVSGMARGLDAIAHAAALDAGGTTIGVLGNGLGVIYPAANRALYERVAREGLLLTEFPPGERPHAGSFPRRNRLISGLATVTVVVEAAAGSGALITASSALEQGREVMAVPGPITSPISEGTNRLIRDGATPYLEPADLLAHYPVARHQAPRTTSDNHIQSRPLDSVEARIVTALAPGAMPLDLLALRVGLDASALQAHLLVLELDRIVEQIAGSQARLATTSAAP